MPFPFRNPVSDDEEEWSPPDYATPTSESSSEWKPPSYATTIKKEEKKPSVFSRAYEALVHPKRPSKITDPLIPEDVKEAGKKVWKKVSEPLTEAPTRFAEKVSEYINPKRETKGIRGISSAYFEALGRTISGLSSPLNLGLAATGVGEAAGIPGAAFATKALSAPVVAEGLKNIYEGEDVPEKLLGGVEAATGALGFRPRIRVPKAELSIRRGKEIPYRMEEPAAAEIPKAVETPKEVPKVEETPKEEPKKPFVSPFEKKPEMVKLYRGESDISEAGPEAGRYFTDRPDVALYYSKRGGGKGRIYSVELPAEEAAKYRDVKSAEEGSHLLPQELSDKARQEGQLGKKAAGEGIVKPKAAEGWKPPEYAKSVEAPEEGLAVISPERAEEARRFADQPEVRIPEIVKPGEEFRPPEEPPKYATTLEGQLSEMEKGLPKIESYEGRPELIEMHGGLGGIKPPESYPPSIGPAGSALDELFGVLSEAKDLNEMQAAIYKTERARRFAAFAGVKEEGAAGAAKSLSKLRGEFEKVKPGEGLGGLSPEHTDTLFTAVKKANITEGEKARGYTALFKLLNGESVPQRNELKILDDVFGNRFADRITMMHGGIGAVGIKLSKLASTMKSMMSSADLSAPLRQGIGLIHRREFGPAFSDMFKFFGSKKFFDTSMEAIAERPNYLLKREAGLFIAKPGSLQSSEEAFLNSYVGDIPRMTGIPQTIEASNRAYTGFLNKLRDDVSESMLKKAESLGYKKAITVGEGEKAQLVPTKETKAIMRFVNTFSGRGELPFGLEKMTNELNTVLWSPRMIASRIQMFTNPKIYTDLPKGMRLEGLKSLLAIASLGTVIDTALAFAGAKVSYNILSSDFGKSRLGTKLLDPWGGLQQYVVNAARFLAGKTDSPYPTSRLRIAGGFLAGKESPAASLAHNILTAKKFTGGGGFITQYGQETSIQSEIGKRFVPMFIKDLGDLATSEPSFADDIGLNTALGTAALFGMGVQQYPEKKQGKLGFRKMRLK